MNTRYFSVVLLFAALTVLSFGHTTAQAQDAATIAKRLQDKYNTVQSLRAEFTQTMTSAFSDDAATSSGVLVVSGDKYRVETATQTLVTDGVTTSIYLPEENQVLLNDFIQDETSFSPSEFLLNYDDHFTVTEAETVTLDRAKHIKFSLSPKNKDSFFQEATIWMRDRDDIITRLELLDVNETRMTFVLKNVQLNPTLDDKAFTFTPPKGAEIVDLRS